MFASEKTKLRSNMFENSKKSRGKLSAEKTKKMEMRTVVVVSKEYHRLWS
jgi:hypothetical protein